MADQKSKVLIKKAGLNREYSCNNKRLTNELGNFEFTAFNDYMKELYIWYKENRKLIKKDLL